MLHLHSRHELQLQLGRAHGAPISLPVTMIVTAGPSSCQVDPILGILSWSRHQPSLVSTLLGGPFRTQPSQPQSGARLAVLGHLFRETCETRHWLTRFVYRAAPTGSVAEPSIDTPAQCFAFANHRQLPPPGGNETGAASHHTPSQIARSRPASFQRDRCRQ